MSDCRTCLSLDCTKPDDYDIYSLQQPSIIAAAQSGRITLSSISIEPCVGDSVNFDVTASGDSVDGYSEWSVLGGSLPDGLTLASHGSYATISGTPTTAGLHIFSLLVESTNGDRGAKVYSILVLGCFPCTEPNCIDCGSVVESSLEGPETSLCYGSNFYADTYIISLEIGDTIQITMASSAFDAWLDLYDLSLSGADCDKIVASGSNSCTAFADTVLEYTATKAGLYYLEASSCDHLITGAYTLTVVCP